MPKFYFHIRTSSNFHVDVDGREFESSDLARLEAISAIQEALSECIARGRTIDGRRFEIADVTGAIVEVVSFDEAIRSAHVARVIRPQVARKAADDQGPPD